MPIHRPYEKKPNKLEDEVPVPKQLAPKAPEQLNQGGAQNQELQPPEQTGSFKPPEQPAGPYDRDKVATEKPTNKPSKGSTEYGQTIEKRGGKLPTNPPPDSWKPKEPPKGGPKKNKAKQAHLSVFHSGTLSISDAFMSRLLGEAVCRSVQQNYGIERLKS